MAIHPAFPDMPLSIKSGGNDLLEHVDNDAEDAAPNHMLRYLEVPEAPATAPSTPTDPGIGEEDVVRHDASSFEIHANVHSLTEESYAGHDAITIYISVDGEQVDSLLLYDQMIQGHYRNGKTCISRGQYIDGDTVLPYRFKAVKMIDAAAAAVRGARSDAEKEKLQQLGTIRVSLWYVTRQGNAVPVTNEFRDRSIAGLDEFDFKGKAVSHSVGFGEAVQDGGGAAWSDTMPDFDIGEVAVWEFRCRSRGTLLYAVAG